MIICMIKQIEDPRTTAEAFELGDNNYGVLS